MEDYELTLFDRLEVIKTANKKYDLEHNAYLSFSGGKDSTILHHLLDMALPNNKIPRVFIDTGMEYQMVRNFVLELAKGDERFVILKPSKSIKATLDKAGYPFKSKQHSSFVDIYKKNKDKCEDFKKIIASNKSLLTDYDYIHSLPQGVKTFVKYYYGIREREHTTYQFKTCPKCLREQFEPTYSFKISNRCCYEFKKKPAKDYEKKSGREIVMTGMRKEEGGNREMISGCILTDKNGNLKKFHPLLVVSNEREETFVKANNIKLADIYYPPYNFARTGCAYCPYSLDLQKQIEIGRKLLPHEVARAEIIWKPVFSEYRRLNYRLKSVEQCQLDFDTDYE